MQNLEKKARAYALKNAIAYQGKANQGAVISSLFHEGLKKEDMAKYAKTIADIVKQVNSLSLEQQQKELEQAEDLISKRDTREKGELPRIPNVVEGKIVTRIPPEPSKYNHIGHAISFLFNYVYSQKFHGKCVLRFEDTNPEKVSQEYVDAMKSDVLEYLDIHPDVIRYVSDDMDVLYDYAEKLIKMEKAYACLCSQEELQNLRHDGKECKHRTQKADVNMKYWKDMLSGKYKEGEIALRLKGDMKEDNQVMRDPVILRIVETPHYKLKNKYKVWPMYDFYNPIEDVLCGVTHILRSNEFEQRIELQNYIKDLLGLPKQTIAQYGRFQVIGATTQGREIREAIASGGYIGWDDPRLVTLKALKRRGIVKETYYELLTHVGIAKKSAHLDFDMIAAINRRIIDPKAVRYSCIFNPVELKIKNAPKIKETKVKLHPLEEKERKVKLGDKIFISQQDFNENKGKELRLMHLYNIKLGKKASDPAEFVDEEKKQIQKINWVSEGVEVDIMMPDATHLKGFAEKAIESLKEGDIIQFERFGFVRADKIDKKNKKYDFWFAHK